MISNIFYDLGLQGVVLEDPEYEAGDGWVDETIVMPEAWAVVGYVPQDQYTGDMRRIIREKLDRLEKEAHIVSRMETREIDQEDWAETWKEYFWPTKITPGIVVKPTWRDYSQQPGEIVVDLDPGMAFGTGSHPTSGLCIEMIEAHLNVGDSFLDIGTGSGILLIVAAKIGAERGLGIDLDETAVDVSRSNMIVNTIDTEKFTVRTGNLVAATRRRFDVAVANILPGVILNLLDDIENVLTATGIFICSGILEEHSDSVTEKMTSKGFAILDVRKKDGWIAIAGRRNQASLN